MTDAKQPNIFQRLNNIMKECSYIQKQGTAAYQNVRYKYVSHDLVVSKLQPFLVKHGVITIPSIIEMKQEGNRTEVKLGIVFINIDDPQDKFGVEFWGYGIDTGDKGPGKAVSYAFKYALLKTFMLETGDDPDHDQEAVYEPKECENFGILVTEAGFTLEEVNPYLEHCAKAADKTVPEVKLHASKNIGKFLETYGSWKKAKAKKQ